MTVAAKYDVTGHGVERTVDNPDVGLSLALYHATRPEAPDGAWYVRPAGERQPTYVLERSLGVVTVRRAL